MISKIHWSWRQFRDVIIIRSFLAGLETTICGAQVSFPHPFTPNLSSHLCCHERTGWWRSNWVCPRVRETPGTVLAEWDSSVPRLRRRRFVDGRFGDEMWNVVSLDECHQSAKVRTAVVKRVGARFGLALVPGRSSHVVFIAIHDAYHGFGSAITAYSYTDRQPMARKYDIFLD